MSEDDAACFTEVPDAPSTTSAVSCEQAEEVFGDSLRSASSGVGLVEGEWAEGIVAPDRMTAVGVLWQYSA
ncbi:hypothetical protein [Cernens ardua]|uniref:hypothetical protein n=1 Tax=Cernens ardua TaxID=3402176 RepID=UPI003F9455A8